MNNGALALVLLAVLSAVLVGIYRRVATRIGLLDTPGSRSSHRYATVSGAGIVLAGVFFVVVILLLACGVIGGKTALLFAAVSCVAIVGWLDDRYHLSISLRFSVYAGFSILSVVLIGVRPPVAAGLAMIFVLAHINLFNFMDGIDGLAICQTIFCCAAAAWLLQSNTSSDLIPLSYSLAAIAVGALVWNWSPAKIFLGDAGSILLGLSLAIMAVYSTAEGSLHFVTWFILFAVFICDSTITLCSRALTGEKVYQAHRTHVYQLAARRFNSHAAVTCGYMLINLVFLLPLSVLTEQNAQWRYYYLSIAYIPLVIIGYSYRKRLLCFQVDDL